MKKMQNVDFAQCGPPAAAAAAAAVRVAHSARRSHRAAGIK